MTSNLKHVRYILSKRSLRRIIGLKSEIKALVLLDGDVTKRKAMARLGIKTKKIQRRFGGIGNMEWIYSMDNLHIINDLFYTLILDKIKSGHDKRPLVFPWVNNGLSI